MVRPDRDKLPFSCFIKYHQPLSMWWSWLSAGPKTQEITCGELWITPLRCFAQGKAFRKHSLPRRKIPEMPPRLRISIQSLGRRGWESVSAVGAKASSRCPGLFCSHHRKCTQKCREFSGLYLYTGIYPHFHILAPWAISPYSTILFNILHSADCLTYTLKLQLLLCCFIQASAPRTVTSSPDRVDADLSYQLWLLHLSREGLVNERSLRSPAPGRRMEGQAGGREDLAFLGHSWVAVLWNNQLLHCSSQFESGL